MKYVLPILFLATAAHAHEGGHLHPHETNGLMLTLILVPAIGLVAFAFGKLHK